MNGNGITVEQFMVSCDDLYNAISKRAIEVIKGIDDHRMTEISISNAAHTFIDESNGFIQTENEELLQAFNEVFSETRAIVQNQQRMSHYEAEVKRAQQSADTKAIEENKRYKDMATSSYLSALQRAVTAVAKAKNVSIGMKL